MARPYLSREIPNDHSRDETHNTQIRLGRASFCAVQGIKKSRTHPVPCVPWRNIKIWPAGHALISRQGRISSQSFYWERLNDIVLKTLVSNLHIQSRGPFSCALQCWKETLSTWRALCFNKGPALKVFYCKTPWESKIREKRVAINRLDSDIHFQFDLEEF